MEGKKRGKWPDSRAKSVVKGVSEAKNAGNRGKPARRDARRCENADNQQILARKDVDEVMWQKAGGDEKPRGRMSPMPKTAREDVADAKTAGKLRILAGENGENRYIRVTSPVEDATAAELTTLYIL